MPNIPDDINWTLINTEDWGGGLERTYRAEDIGHAGCGGDVLLVHLHDEMGAITGAHSRCAKCDEDLTEQQPIRCTRCGDEDGPFTDDDLCEPCARPVPLGGAL